MISADMEGVIAGALRVEISVDMEGVIAGALMRKGFTDMDWGGSYCRNMLLTVTILVYNI